MRGSLNRKIWGCVFLLPQLIGLVLFSLVPVANAFSYSFVDWDGFATEKVFVGFANYAALFKSSDFYNGLSNTLIYMLVHVPAVIILSLLIAVALKNIWGKLFYRLLYFMPVVTGSVAVGVIWTWLLNADFGFINQMIDRVFGVAGPMWLVSPKLVLVSLAIVATWWRLGYYMVIFLAGLQNVPATYYEAAKIDGAGNVRQFLHITLPLISPTTFFITIIAIIHSFQVFDLALIMTNGGPGKASRTFVYEIYQSAFVAFRMGKASASAIILLVIILVATGVQMKLSSRWVNYDY